MFFKGFEKFQRVNKKAPAEEKKNEEIKTETPKTPENIDNLKKSNEEKIAKKVKNELDEGKKTL